MTLKNSYFKGGAQRNVWVVVLSSLGLLLAGLLPTVMSIQNTYESIESIATLGNQIDLEAQKNIWESGVRTVSSILSGNPIVMIIISALAVICGVSGFAYLHSRQKVDFYHSLPISRGKLFAKNYMRGIVGVIPAYVIITLLSVLCAYGMGMAEAVVWSEIVASMLFTIIVFWVGYSMSVLATVLCGNTLISLLLYVWMMFGGFAAVMLKNALCMLFFETYYSPLNSVGITEFLWSPFITQFFLVGTEDAQTAMQSTVGMSLTTVSLTYLAVALAISAIAFFAFRIRKSERAGTALAFEPIKLPIKVLMCAMIGLVTALLLRIMGGSVWLWVGLVLGTVLFHMIVEIIYAFDFRAALAKPLHLICILVALFAVVLCLENDVLGYDKYVPPLEDLTGVRLTVEYDRNEDSDMMRTAENIAAVHQLATLSVTSEVADGYQTWYCVDYRLRGGKVVTRQLLVPETDETKKLRVQIFRTEEYKTTQWGQFRYQPEQYDENRLSISGKEGEGMLEDKEIITQIIRTLQEESLTRSENARPVELLWVSGNDKEYRSYYYEELLITDEDVRTLALIKEHLHYEPEEFVPTSITVQFRSEQMNGDTSATITDPADIAAIWQSSVIVVWDDTRTLMQGIAVDRNEYYCTADNEKNSVSLSFRYGQTPTAVLEKYRAQATPLNEDGASDTESMGEVAFENVSSPAAMVLVD